MKVRSSACGMAHASGRAMVLLCGLVLTASAALAQVPSPPSPLPSSRPPPPARVELPRRVFEVAAARLHGVDIAPAAWRVVLTLDSGTATSDLAGRLAADAATGPIWLTLQARGLGAGEVPAAVDAVRGLIEARPDVAVVELDVTALDDQRVADFLTRRLSIAVKSGRDDLAVARSLASASMIPQLDEEGLTTLLDVLVVPDEEGARAAAALIAERGLDLRTAVLGGDPGATPLALAGREIARLGRPPDIAGYRLPDDPGAAAALLDASRTLGRAVEQDLTPIDAELRLVAAERDVTDTWRPRVLFGTDTLATFVAVDIVEGAPLTATLRLVLPVPGSVSLFDPAGGHPAQRDGRVVVHGPAGAPRGRGGHSPRSL